MWIRSRLSGVAYELICQGALPQETVMSELNAKLSRRKVFAGAGTAGALAAAAAALPLVKNQPAEAVATAKPEAEQGEGYQLTQHVLRYYQTARV